MKDMHLCLIYLNYSFKLERLAQMHLLYKELSCRKISEESASIFVEDEIK